MEREKPLRVPGGFEPAHLPFSLARKYCGLLRNSYAPENEDPSAPGRPLPGNVLARERATVERLNAELQASQPKAQ